MDRTELTAEKDVKKVITEKKDKITNKDGKNAKTTIGQKTNKNTKIKQKNKPNQYRTKIPNLFLTFK